MEKEKMNSKMESFIIECGYASGFTAYMAYCYMFDIQYDKYIHIDSEDMSFEDFKDWLSDYMYEYQDDFEEIIILGCHDDTYCNVSFFK